MAKGRQLPPLDALVVFETAARAGSFSRAGDELGLTQSAVSRQIGKLESFIGSKLFTRTPQGVIPTVTGETYVQEVSRLLDGVAGATEGIRAWRGPRQITIACSRGIADLWVLPRLAALKADIADLELRLRVTDDVAHLRTDEYDLAIFYRRERPVGLAVTELAVEEIVPVASPGTAPLEEQESPVLLSIDDPVREWFGWGDWLADADVARPVGARDWKLGDYRLAVEAAAQGIGVTLGWSWLIADHLRSGRLVPVHAHWLRPSGRFYLLRPLDRHARRIVREVSDWIIATAEADGAA